MASVLGLQITQAALTILAGVIVYVLGRFVEVAGLQPLAEQRRIMAEVATALTMYANLYTNPKSVAGDKPEHVDQGVWEAAVAREDELYREASGTLRELSARLQGHNLSIPWYGLWARLGLAPSRQHVLMAGANLIGISNMISPSLDLIQQNMQWRSDILRNLGLLKLRAEPPAKSQPAPGGPGRRGLRRLLHWRHG
jgi:hypothetical protein